MCFRDIRQNYSKLSDFQGKSVSWPETGLNKDLVLTKQQIKYSY